ncbi:MAG TPA: hypothetical protein DDW19_03885 [Anaerolineaceae bacterium]|jgi:hypothetical protein|nr:hypothetical protein [Anaerolineaceae bacterium]
MDGDVTESVECYSGSEYPERPLAFHWLGERLEVKKVLDASITPRGKTFRVMAANGQEFILGYDQQLDRWQIAPV